VDYAVLAESELVFADVKHSPAQHQVMLKGYVVVQFCSGIIVNHQPGK